MTCGCFGGSVVQRKRSTAKATGGIDEQLLRRVNHFSYNQLRSATDVFHPSNKIGRGGFGTVYKGILKDGTEIAVKTLAAESKQGAREFLTEINTISNVKHPNLVELIGCCIQGANRMLVYEYVQNKSLDKVLLDQRSRNIKLDWSKRSAICMDNITHISTRLTGTTGYLAPEYALGGQLTMKADVYSFGVLVLEIISGRSSSKTNCGGTEMLLLGWAWQLYEEGKLLELVDPELGELPEEEVLRYMKVAFFCTQAAANRRPIMSQVIKMLGRNVRLNETELMAPEFFQDGVASSGKKSTESSATSTSYQMSFVPAPVTEVTPR
ncbi:hypothetical protein V6N12_062935 [Hibiscus sabdariffa]|uniref:Protein kinase domain-containing protein n=1 Tax=Hibiscus sabdariffa TaxID=183260 RepID=A0ABR2FAI8_9ROSI